MAQQRASGAADERWRPSRVSYQVPTSTVLHQQAAATAEVLWVPDSILPRTRVTSDLAASTFERVSVGESLMLLGTSSHVLPQRTQCGGFPCLTAGNTCHLEKSFNNAVISVCPCAVAISEGVLRR